jgi:hypothetical protein
MFRTTPEAPEAAMSTTITDQIATYRRHAAAQLRMTEHRNRAELAGRNTSRWSERSLQAYSAHGDVLTGITGQLHLTGQSKLAAALVEEAHALSALSWSKMSGKTNVGELTQRVSALRLLVNRLAVTDTGRDVADFRRHAAAVRRLSRRGSDSARSVAALAEHTNACRHYAAKLSTDVAFALATEHNLLSRAARYREIEGTREGMRDELARVRRVVRRAVR